MRPIELTVEGFRSYRSPTTFDWRDRRLVGIVGPIGAGKSSILDAMAFALYGKTPEVGRDTKSLIHQLCEVAHVALTFEVGDEVWKAVRAPKRKGQSGHQLFLLASAEPGAETLETVTQESAVNARVEQLLGMDFHTFCRSVLLAQNRFSDFLKATRTERDKVLKGVFGYARLDAAKAATERRFDHEQMLLDSFGRERQQIDEARGRLEQTRGEAEAASATAKAMETAAPRVEQVGAERAEAATDATAAATAITGLEDVARAVPDGDQVERVVGEATHAHASVEAARAAVEAAEAERTTRDAEFALVRERLGDREQLRSFERLVERHGELAEKAHEAIDLVRTATEASAEAAELLERRRAEAAETAERMARADDQLSEVVAIVAETRHAALAARHREMAHELRAGLVEGEPCPVCAQPVATRPHKGPAPKAVVAAEKALAKAEREETKARAGKEQLAAQVAAAGSAAEEAERRLGESAAVVEAAESGARAAEAELAAAKDQLTERLGDGEPQALLASHEAELAVAEGAAVEAASAEGTARRSLEDARVSAEGAKSELARLANQLAGVWGRLGTPRAMDGDPEDVRTAFVEVAEQIVQLLGEARTAADAADARIAAADTALADILASVGLAPGDDFVAARARAAAELARAEAAIEELEHQIAGSNDLEQRILEAEARSALARRLSDDLKPSRFLAYLLEEERAELAELGSGSFETLTGGTYRFAADDSFDIVDLNAADRTRKAGSLSGGETFLASLALALALAEMVARGGGRLEAFFLDEGFGSLDPEHLDRAMTGIERLVAEDGGRLVVLVSHVAEMREALEDLIVLAKDERTGDTVVVSGAAPA